jgi:quercetin dioxygenase-like cupin family protein
LSTERLEAIHRQLDGSANVLATIESGAIKRTPQGILLTNGATAWTIYANSSCNVLMSEYVAGATWPLHCHTESIEFLICTEGEFQISIRLLSGDMEIILSKGQDIKLPPNTLHSVNSKMGGKLIAVCIPPETGY